MLISKVKGSSNFRACVPEIISESKFRRDPWGHMMDWVVPDEVYEQIEETDDEDEIEALMKENARCPAGGRYK